MDHRDEAFRRKFTDAARHLGVEPHQLVSVKFRENVGGYEEYHRLLHEIGRESGLRCSEVPGDLQGRGWMLDDGKSKVLLVEHETGLEILYIAGSIASMVSLIPLVIQCWRSIRPRTGAAFEADEIEVRRLGRDGQVQERRGSGAFAFLATPIGFNTALTTAARLIGDEMKWLMDEVKALSSRVDELEKRIVSPGTPKKRRVAGRRSGKK